MKSNFTKLGTVVLLLTAFTFLTGGLIDRFSGINLTEDNIGDFPEISAPSGNPATNHGWLYVKDATGTSNLYFEADDGTVTDLITGTNTLWNNIVDPSGAGSITFGTYTSLQTGASTAANQWTWKDTAAFGDIALISIEQDTGNPTDGKLLQLKLADTDPDFLSLYRGSELLKIDSSGVITAGAVAIDYTDFDVSADGVVTLASDDSPAAMILLSPSAATTTGLDASDTDLVNAVTVGANVISGTDWSIDGTGNLLLDDGVTHSPTITLTDATGESGILQKLDSADLTATVLAADSLRVVTGNLRVGNGTPSVASMNGEDAYVEGELEVGGAVTLTGAVTLSGGLNLSDGNITNVGDISLDTITSDGTTIGIGQTAGDDITVGNSTGDLILASDDYDLTLTDTTDDVFRINNSGGAVLIDIDLGAADAITVGSGAETVIINSSDWDVNATGDISNAGSITSDGAISTTSTFNADGDSTIGDTTAGANVTIGNSTGNITMASDNADITLTDTTDNVFQIVNSSAAIMFDIDLGATDLITLGSGAEQIAISSPSWDISNLGAGSGFVGLSTSGTLASTGSIDVDGAANISDTTAGSDVAIGNSTGDVLVLSDDVNISLTDTTDNAFQVENATGPVVYIDLDLGAADGLTLGNVAGLLALNSSDWTVDATGNVAGIGTVASNGLYTFTGANAAADAFKVDVADAATGQYFVVDAGPWLGTAGEGAISFASDSAATAEAGTVIRVALGGTAADAAAIEGKVLYASDEAASTPGSYLVSLDSENNGGIHLIDGELLVEADAGLYLEGATADAYEAELETIDPTTDNIIVLPDYSGGIPVIIANSQTQTDATGVGANTPITGSSLTLAQNWFSAGKALRWTLYGTSDGSGGAAMTCGLDIDGSQFGIVELTTSQSDDWMIECTLNEYTALANQKILCKLDAEGEPQTVEYDVDTTNMAAGATVVRMECDTNSATDHIYVESVMIEHWEK